MNQSPESRVQNPENKKISFFHPASLVCTAFGVGHIRPAPGTWGSLFGIILFAVIVIGWHYSLLECVAQAWNWAAHETKKCVYDDDDFELYFYGGLLVTFLLSIYAIRVYQKKTGKSDAPEIVIDEVFGQILAILVFASIADFYKIDYEFSPIQTFLLLFITFRLFDILKPGPIGWLDRKVKGAWGVMLDDLLSGVFAGVAAAILVF